MSRTEEEREFRQWYISLDFSHKSSDFEKVKGTDKFLHARVRVLHEQFLKLKAFEEKEKILAKAIEFLNILKGLHEANVFVSKPWDETFEEISKLISENENKIDKDLLIPKLAIELGNYGVFYDMPDKCRAYTYQAQPGNAKALKLGLAVRQTEAISDGVDHGLSLLKSLEEQGFGVFELTKKDN